MSHLSQLVCSMYADGALTPRETADAEQHLASCASCRTRVAALDAESRALRAALLPEDADYVAVAPPWRRGLRLLDLLGLAAAAAATAWTSSVFWSALVAAVPSSLRWLSPLDPRALWDFGIDIAVFIANEGSSMLNSISSFATVAAFAAVLGGAAAALRRQTGAAQMLVALLAVLALPSKGHAFELRRSNGGATELPAGETVDDTLIAIGDTVTIEGNVNGDLIAFARHVTVSGNVMGDVLGGAETVEISGTVGGNVVAGGNQVNLLMARVAGNLYSGGRNVRLDNGTQITGNAVAAGNDIDIDGAIGIDLRAYGNGINLRGNVTRNFGAYGETITLLAPARVGGDLTAHVSAAEKLQIANGATVAGNVDRQISAEPAFPSRGFKPPVNRYATAGFYFGQVVRLAAAFVTGLLLLALFPALRTPPLRSGLDLVKAGGIGLVTAIVAPIAALIACITVILAPVGIIGFVVGAIALYLAKIPVAQLVGLLLFKSKPHFAATLLAGLAIVIVAVNLPLVGWLFGVVITCVGLGMLLMHALDAAGRGHVVR